MKMKILSALLFATIASVANGQTSPRYFGYYFNDASSDNSATKGINENYDHVNLYHIGGWSGSTTASGRQATIQYTLSELARAKSLGVKAIITAAPLVFRWNANNGKWLNEPDAPAIWSGFVDQLIQAGYLVPNNPGASTVAAIYLVDEPNTSGLADYKENPKVNVWQPSEALLNALQAIRSNPNMGLKFPIATILSTGFTQYFKSGIRQFDWIGFDDYTISPSQWDQEYNQLKSMIRPGSKIILVPQAATGGCGLDSSYDDPNKFNNLMTAEPKVVWLAPFVWFSRTGCPGTRDIPALRAAYTQIGHYIKSH